MSEGLRGFVLEEFHTHEQGMYERASKLTSDAAFLAFPFMDKAGVINNAIYDVAAKRFTKIEVPIARTGIMSAEWLRDGAVYCDGFEYEVIELEKK